MVFVETYEEWNKRHGGNCVIELHADTGKQTGWKIWPDGAACRTEDFEHRKDPPANQYELLQIKRNYHWTRIHNWEKEFNAAKDALSAHALMAKMTNNIPMPDQGAIVELKKFAARIAKEAISLRVTEAALYHTPEQRQKRELELLDAEIEHRRYLQIADFETSLTNLNIPYAETESLSDEELKTMLQSEPEEAAPSET
jgi:hypothetical protein